jgi:single-strand DNA-binding protein
MNTIQLIGRLTQDPELRFTNGGMATTTLRLAVPRRKRNGEDQAPVYVDVVTFDKQAEAVSEYLVKGRRVAVTGRLEYREWKDNDGNPHSKHEVIADQVEFMDPKDPKPNGSATAENAYAAGEEPF